MIEDSKNPYSSRIQKYFVFKNITVTTIIILKDDGIRITFATIHRLVLERCAHNSIKVRKASFKQGLCY